VVRTFRLAALLPLLALIGCAGEPKMHEGSATDVAAVRSLLEHIQQTFNSGDLNAFMPVFAEDAVLLAPGAPDAVGRDAIRAVYEGALAQAKMTVEFRTQEIKVSGDLAFERGTYTIHVTDKSSGHPVAEITNRHIHVFRRQPDGTWKTWRMMVNAAAPAPATP
jgi:uncharacterized protein (TIGR02246 family)